MSNASDQPYAWQDGEREAIEAEMAERQRQIDRAGMLQWAHARAVARGTGDTVMKNTRANDNSKLERAQLWHDYIEERIGARIDAREKIMQKALAQVLIEQEQATEKVGSELVALREKVARLETELGEIKREAELRGTLNSIAERLDRIEARSAGMKVIPGKAVSDLIA
jgi:hypothetical protein